MCFGMQEGILKKTFEQTESFSAILVLNIDKKPWLQIGVNEAVTTD